MEVTFGAAIENGKIAVVDSAHLLCAPDADASACGGTTWFDLVGYGSAAQFEGAAAAPALTTDKAAFRKGGKSTSAIDTLADHGCFDTGDNSADFELGTPTPRNSDYAASTCDTASNDAGADADASDAASDASDAATDAGDAGKDAGWKDKDGGKDGGKRPLPEASAGDDDDDTPVEQENPDDGKPKPGPKTPLRSGSSSCSATPGPIDAGAGLSAAFGLAMALASFRLRRRPSKK
jgi:MYXO-CTERM domain-containing protein